MATGTIMSIIAIMACLLLVSRHSGFREMGAARAIRLALIWGAIILALVLVINIFQQNGVS